MQYVLVFNSGSSSFKFSLFPSGSDTPVLNGSAERLGADDARMRMVHADGKSLDLTFACDHPLAIQTLVEKLPEFGFSFAEVQVVGHRVVHGGESFAGSVLVSAESLAAMRACNPLAPLHNPANLMGIEILAQLYPALPQVAVFDTAFHQTLPKEAYLYPVPYHLYRDSGVRRYGFHGTSHRYVSQACIAQLGLATEDNQLLVAHLGNGCSATAVRNGQSVDTTMGLTPLEGLVMGTRSGDVDPSLHQFLQANLGWDLDRITDMLNRESGLLGLSELSNDMRELQQAADNGNCQAALAIEVFCFRLARQLAGLAASLSRLDALVFTGGIGENNPYIRARVAERLTLLGLTVDAGRNRDHGKSSGGTISCDGDGPKVMVIKTNEEALIARDALALVSSEVTC